MTAPFRLDRPRVRALLGPTNTGKTHLAIERLMAHDSGIIGFPLRLLARENYDRMVARKGPSSVALITGEEKILPPGARWFACTVEAMPLDRPVACIAVDEIQLCADPDRGHVFTDRLMHARGFAETLFLGAETIAPLLRRLVPTAEIETRPRLSRLVHDGPLGIARLPPRSAVVAFSAAEVYAAAEAIRRRRGGCAIVMGRLSPRTRNAQVGLFQSGEVDFLVATDAIGMGLNMDVNHVAFAGLTKFDGRRVRPLDPAELGQIAGRAGRGMRDGTFGTLGAGSPIEPDLADRVESHRFAPLTTLAWRNGALDFASPHALLASLAQPAPASFLQRTGDALDHTTLQALLRDPALREKAASPARLKLLWEACQIPDFRKLGDDSHARFCARIFTHLADPPERLPADWIARSLEELARIDGDVDTLMQRLTGVRVWAYVAARADWVAQAAEWQARARAIEDQLSDALHEHLTARFVDRRAAHLLRRLEKGEPDLLASVSRAGEVRVEGHLVGRLDGFVFRPDAAGTGAGGRDGHRALLRAARRVLAREVAPRVSALEAAPDSAFRLDEANRIAWQVDPAAPAEAGWAMIARLRSGAAPDRPAIEIIDSEFLDGAARDRIARRLSTWLAAYLAAGLAPLPALLAAGAQDATVRGVLHLLREGLGIVARPRLAEGAAAARPALRRLGVVLGRHACFMPALLKPAAMRLRAQLLALAAGQPPLPLPTPGLVSVPAPAGPPPARALALGWVPAGPVLVRLDVAERIAAELVFLTRRGAQPLPTDLAARLGCRAALVPEVLRGLGFRLSTDAAGTRILRPRHRPAGPRATRPRAAAAAHGHPAFAALAGLKR